jgi:hypothetical protein
MEGASATGAHTFVIKPGRTTVMDVTAALFVRTKDVRLGLAPLGSMYLHGKEGQNDDFRRGFMIRMVSIFSTGKGRTFGDHCEIPVKPQQAYSKTKTPAAADFFKGTGSFMIMRIWRPSMNSAPASGLNRFSRGAKAPCFSGSCQSQASTTTT